jgi:hypothetical protein
MSPPPPLLDDEVMGNRAADQGLGFRHAIFILGSAALELDERTSVF